MKTAVAHANVNMRRSCHFCRLRKIRCSGQNICSACRERNIDCVYEAEASKGRPKNGAIRGRVEKVKGSRPPQLGPNFPQSAYDYISQTPDLANDNLSVDLRNSFEDYFGNRSYPVKNGSPRPSGQMDSATSEMFIHGSENASTASLGLPNIDNERILETINYEIIETVCNNVSNLGCEPLGRNKTRLISKSMLIDRSTRMFDPAPRAPVEDPLPQNETHTTLQMIDVWLSSHPLSCIISKTLFLRSIRNNDYDHGLLAIMLSDAFGFSISKGSQEEAEKFYYWAVACLQNTSYSTVSMSTAQTLILLGWHELRQNRPKQAICYFTVASRVVRVLWESITEGDGPCTSQINGVCEGEVETELIINMQWITSALRLWILLQIDPSLVNLDETKSFTTLVISNETDSKLVELDLASDNVSTLNAQAKSLRSLLSLSVTTLTASRLLVIYDQHEKYYTSTPTQYGWPGQHPPQVSDKRMLMESFTAQSRVAIENVCKASYSASQNSMSRAESDLMFSIFEFAIFFPHSGEQNPQKQLIDERKSEELLAMLKLILQQPLLGPHLTMQEMPQLNNAELPTELIVLTLDVSARVLGHLVNFYTGDRTEQAVNPTKNEDLSRISAMMIGLLRSDRLPFSGSRIRPTKRLLRKAKMTLAYRQNPSNIHPMEPTSSESGGSDSSGVASPWQSMNYTTTAELQIPPGLFPTAGAMPYDPHGLPVTTAPPTLHLSPEYTYPLNDQIATTFPEDHHYKIGLAPSAPADERRAEKFPTMSNPLIYAQYY
ncbi:hypothetical protein DRE_03425 [Drechslerella stenobrocha 248]|uniref:Zn(2)-C6 fungal-type domain-containing protein n=1 Tax=Drechslerella stenobrocha 248 TaxID=1043628 RepID=W7HT83_9PEZI|nr:hypothetical protein DRE_03425 [Drechslerella stenobrocha 248]